MKMFSLFVMVGLCCTALAQTPAPAKGTAEEEVAKVQELWLNAEQHWSSPLPVPSHGVFSTRTSPTQP